MVKHDGRGRPGPASPGVAALLAALRPHDAPEAASVRDDTGVFGLFTAPGRPRSGRLAPEKKTPPGGGRILRCQTKFVRLDFYHNSGLDGWV